MKTSHLLTKVVELQTRRPFSFRGTFLWFDEGTLFEVVEEKELPQLGICYKLRLKKNPTMFMDGFNIKKDFKDWVLGEEK